MNKKIIATIAISIGISTFVIWHYSNKYIQQRIDSAIHQQNIEQSELIVRQKHKETISLAKVALDYYEKKRPQSYLAQHAFFKLIDLFGLLTNLNQKDNNEIITLIQQLLDTKLVNIEALNDRYQTALYCATMYNNFKLFKILLLEYKANPNTYCYAETPLFVASPLKPDMVKLLLEHKADPNLPGYEGKTALMNVFSFLESWISTAESTEHDIKTIKKSIDLLLSYGANPMIKDKAGNSAMSILKETEDFIKTGKKMIIAGELKDEFKDHWKEDLSAKREYILKTLEEIETEFKSHEKITN